MACDAYGNEFHVRNDVLNAFDFRHESKKKSPFTLELDVTSGKPLIV